jgi:3alpha(or 20beta)-hydroxysteroid dehydrogenase
MNKMFSLEGQVAVVTGGGSGIGLETVVRFREAGARVVLADIADSAELAQESGAAFCRCDVTVESEVRAMLEFAVARFGELNILVNNAGVFSDYLPIGEKQRSSFDLCYSVNVLGTALGIKHAAALMADRGRIINMASAAGIIGAVGLADYVASKHAVVGLTRSAALDLAERNIRVNCVCPTTVDTPMASEEGGEHLIEGEKLLVPLGRICRPAEVAALVHFLASDDCGFINGQAIVLDGGMSCGTNSRMFAQLLA